MESCCKITYDHTFDLNRAKKEMAQYLKTGPKKTTNYLLNPLKEQLQDEGSLLDIGSGVGAIIWELFEDGIDYAHYIEISEGYTEVFRQQVVSRSVQQQVKSQTGDFTEYHQQIPQVDVVTLDKVICCYEDYKPLVRSSLPKARKLYAYTIPLDVWWVKVVNSVTLFFESLFSNQLPTYIHPVREIEEMVVTQGFEKIYQKSHREWLTVIYTRNE